MSARSLLSAVLLLACDDAGSDAQPPVDACDEVILVVGASSLARCPDGARFSWRHADRVILSEATAGLRIAGVDALGPSWPDVAWRVEDAGVTVRHGGRADLPDLDLILTLGDGRLTTRLTFTADDAIVVDALIAPSGGLRGVTSMLQGGEFAAVEDAAAMPGFGIWSGALAIAAHATRPTEVHPDGRVTRGPLGTLAPGATFELETRWTVGAPGPALRSAQPDDPPIGWGWRTGATHGAVVDPAALSAQRDALLALGPDPWIVIDGLWAPALGDWRPPVDLIEALAPARVGVYWPATLVCPDAPLHAAEPGLYVPAEGACGRLDLSLPAARDVIARAGIALLDAGVSGIWMDDPALSSAFDLAAPSAFEGPASIVHLDRVDGAPAEACRIAAVEGPFPRGAACAQQLGTLDAPGVPPTTDPRDGVTRLLEHLDLPRVAPLPLTLGAADGAARQRLALAALGGGALLLADTPSSLPDRVGGWLQRAAANDLHRLGPLLDPADWPPAIWQGDAGLALFNWRDSPRRFVLPDRWIGASGVFDLTPAAAEIVVPPGDVRLLVAD